MLLSSAYFPPLSWLALVARDMTLSPDRVLPSRAEVELQENYQKQSYRNRCYILSADGPQMLQVPVVHGASWRMADVRVDYSTPWVVRTQRALDTAYETAAYYEYYRNEVFALLDARPETLWELNLSTARFLLGKMGVTAELVPSARFAIPGSVADDYRYEVHPKHPDSILEDLGLARPYYQVFRERMGGFTPRLSGLDLLFNEGPDSIGWIKRLH